MDKSYRFYGGSLRPPAIYCTVMVRQELIGRISAAIAKHIVIDRTGRCCDGICHGFIGGFKNC